MHPSNLNFRSGSLAWKRFSKKKEPLKLENPRIQFSKNDHTHTHTHTDSTPFYEGISIVVVARGVISEPRPSRERSSLSFSLSLLRSAHRRAITPRSHPRLGRLVGKFPSRRDELPSSDSEVYIMSSSSLDSRDDCG